jgi:uncharacterized protein YecE (DUF72 family)
VRLFWLDAVRRGFLSSTGTAAAEEAITRNVNAAQSPTSQADATALSEAATQAGDIRIGISGWNYAPWRGVFYPAGLPHKRELSFAASQFSSIEINGTFYSLQRPSSFVRWAEHTPPGFIFSVKGPRYITHMLRLRNAEGALANFFAQGVLALEEKLGPILWQLPPRLAFDPVLLEEFFLLLPRSSAEAATLSQRHHPRLDGRSHTTTSRDRPLRHALEIRHDSYRSPEFLRLLRRYDIALVCADTVEWPRLMDATASFVYCRLHGSRELYASGYGRTSIATWADRIVAWATGRPPAGERVLPFTAAEAHPHDVYVYFDNDIKVRAPADAKALERRVRRLMRKEPPAPLPS